MIFNAYHVGSSYHQHAKGLEKISRQGVCAKEQRSSEGEKEPVSYEFDVFDPPLIEVSVEAKLLVKAYRGGKVIGETTVVKPGGSFKASYVACPLGIGAVRASPIFNVTCVPLLIVNGTGCFDSFKTRSSASLLAGSCT